MSYLQRIASHSGYANTSVRHQGDEAKVTFNTKRYSTRHKRMREMFDSMTTEELKELANEKAPNGCATELAIEAQKYLYNFRR